MCTLAVLLGGTPALLFVLCAGKCCFPWKLCVCARGSAAYLLGGGALQDACECERRLVECEVGLFGIMGSQLTICHRPIVLHQLVHRTRDISNDFFLFDLLRATPLPAGPAS